MEIIKARDSYMKDRKRFWILLMAAGVFFFTMLAVSGVELYNDSQQYIDMHIHRDPGYCVFLWIMRLLGGENYLILTGIMQALLAAWCTADFTDYITTQFTLGKCSVFVVFMCTLMPHIITPLFSASRIVLSAGIMSEALCLPLFLMFVKELHKAVINEDKRAVLRSFVLCLLISLVRAQLTASILIWAIVLVTKVLFNRQHKKVILLLLAVVLFFCGKPFIVKTYNFCVQGHFIGTTYGKVNTLTNILYASDREQGEDIGDEELQKVFYMLYDLMDEFKYNYKYGGDTPFERADYLESIHDDLKFDVCEDGLKSYIKEQGVKGYLPRDLKADEYAGELIEEIFPGCAGRWMAHYLVLGMWGTIRNVAIVHPILSIYAIAVGVIAIIITFQLFKKNRESREAWLMLIALLSIAGISFSTAFTIMCLSRYMVYGFAGFYTAVYLILLKVFNDYNKKTCEA